MRTKFPKHYFLIDVHRDKRQKAYVRQMILRDFLARSALSEGHISWKILEWKENDKFQNRMKLFWQYGIIPPNTMELWVINVSHIKWYIKNKITLQNKIWNGSFLHGIAQSGKITQSKDSFPSLQTYLVTRMKYLLKICPFKGNIFDYGWKWGVRWTNVPALSLSHDTNSLSFMAGVFSMGQEYLAKDGLVYAKYSNKCEKWLKQWGIPIEGYTPNKLQCLISPIWPSLLHEWMPPIIRTWRRIPKASQAAKYAAILWKIYCGGQFVKNAIPYLEDRGYYTKHFKSDEYTLTQNVRRMWVQCNLTCLDERLKELIRKKVFV